MKTPNYKYLAHIDSVDKFCKLVKYPQSTLNFILINKSSFYGSLQQKVKDKIRIFNPPLKELLIIHAQLKEFFALSVRWPIYIQGGVKGKSNITNANLHKGRKDLLAIDILNFFPSISEQKIYDALIVHGICSGAAKIMADLCSFNNMLPQGSSVSSYLANLVLLPTDRILNQFCIKQDFVYSRLIDDISISGNKNVGPVLGYVKHLLNKEGFTIKKHKTLHAGRNQPQVVTKLVVNDKVRPTKEFIRTLKRDIRECWSENGGPEKLAEKYKITKVQLKQKLFGRINYIKQMDKKLARNVRGLMTRINWNQ